MCELTTALLGLSLAGTAVSAAGQVAQGEQAAAMGQLQQQAYDQQARNTQSAASFEQDKERRKSELVAANARAQVGASGVALSGSPAEALIANAGESELDIQAIQWNSGMKQDQLRTQGSLARYSGDAAQTAGYISGASTLLSGGAQAIRMGRSPFARGA